MSTELAFGGIVLLLFSFSMKLLFSQRDFRCLLIAFSVAWGTWVGFHFWIPGLRLVNVFPIFSDGDTLSSLAAFWLLFGLAQIPTYLFLRYRFSAVLPKLPFWFDRACNYLSTLYVIACFLALMTMTVDLVLPQSHGVLRHPGVVGEGIGKFSSFPLKTYVVLAESVNDRHGIPENVSSKFASGFVSESGEKE